MLNFLEISILCFPLVFVLLSLAIFPLLAPNFWHKKEILLFGTVSCISVFSSFFMLDDAGKILSHALVSDYVPFIIMLFTLFLLSHGIHIKLKSSSSTMANVIFLGICSVFASIIGTTGASMLFLRPFLEMNKTREKKGHLVIFFIFLVSNIGGLLSPLGDPPLLLGYLHGVEFSWCFKNLFFAWVCYVSICLIIMSIIDKLIVRKEQINSATFYQKFSLTIGGYLNIFLIFATVLVLFININSICIFNLLIPGICIKNIILIVFCAISYMNSKKINNEKVDFSPFLEVARTFFVIFIVIAPVLFILEENSELIKKYINTASENPSGIYFWLCGAASSVLDNAPSYLLFFNMAGGSANELMNIYPSILKAIAISTVVMGSITYIGNAPNMMVRHIAEKRGIKMPSFIGYMKWSCLIILPISIIMTFVLGSN